MKLNELQEYALRLLKWILLPLSTISGFMSYRGVMTINDDVIIAICYAVGVGSVLYLLASLCITIIPVLSNHNRQGSAWSAFTLAILIAISMSSYTNLAGIIGPSVQLLDAKHHIENVQVVLSDTSLIAQSAQSTVTSLQAERSRFLTLAEKEKTSGTLSGSKGTGVITGAYIQAANIIDATANALASKKHDLVKLIIEANKHLEKMRATLNEDKDIKIRTLELASINRELQSSYEQLVSTNLHQVIENSLGSLDSIIAVSTSNNSSLRKTQEQVIKRIRADFAQTKRRYTVENQLAKHDIPEYPVWEPRFQTRLLLDYAIEIIPYIVAAIAIDSGVFIVALLLIALRREMDDDEAEVILEGRKYTLKELDETLKLFKRLNSSDKDKDEEGDL